MNPKKLQHTFEALAGFRYALRKFLRFSKDYLASAQMTPEQYEALLALRAARTPLTIGALSERLQVKHHSAVGLANKLEQRRLIRRVEHPTDRRVVHLELCKQGHAVIEQLAEAHRQRVCELRDEITAALRRLGRNRSGSTTAGAGKQAAPAGVKSKLVRARSESECPKNMR